MKDLLFSQINPILVNLIYRSNIFTMVDKLNSAAVSITLQNPFHIISEVEGVL